MWMISFMGN